MTKLAEGMVEFAQSARFEDMSDTVVHHAKRRILDTVGCALGAYSAQPVRIARRLALPVGEGGARVIGSLVRTTPDLAAFANGSMVRYLDFNDSGGGHPSDNFAGVLAAAELAQASGRDFITALAVAYELQNRLTISIPFYDHGWDQAVPLVMGCSLACGRLLGLTTEQMHHALALAVVPNLATFQSRSGAELSMWKACAAPNGARQAVFAAQLAGAGMSGPSDPIDGTFGLWAQTVGKPYEVRPFKLEPGCAITITMIKRYPVRDTLQLIVDTAVELRKQVAAADIELLHIDTYQTAYDKSVHDPENWEPRTRETADHSMLAVTTITLLDGCITPDTYTLERYMDADVLALIKRTDVEVTDEFNREFRERAVRHCRMTAIAKNGERYVSHKQLTRDDIARGPTDAEVEEKFVHLTRDILPASERRSLIDFIWNLDSVSNINQFIDRLRV